jgi:surfeit locus 1 family protein
VPVVFHAGARAFAPSWLMTLLTVLACVAFVNLGLWQWHKGQLRQAEWDRFARGADSVRELGGGGLADVARFQRVSLTGRYDAAHQFLLDNRTYKGRAGYEVLTPLARPDGRVALVDRGWVPFSGVRSQLPQVALASEGPVTLTGRSDELPAAGLESGRAAPAEQGGWPKVTSYPAMAQLGKALGTPLEARILLLDPDQPQGYARDWQPPGMQPLRHLSYAIQWWAFTALAIILWVIMSLKRQVKDS